MLTFSTRRATTDDLGALVALWESAGLSAAELEKQFTDFQVAIDNNNRLVAAIALRIESQQGQIHTEAYIDFALTDCVRPLLWKRLQTVAQNHGLYRLWTTEPAPFWKKEVGFVEADAPKVEKLPNAFGSRDLQWLTLQLRDEVATPEALDKEFAMFREASRANTERAFQQARTLKIIATFLAALLFVLVLIGGFYLLRHGRAPH
jgi:N-acetylglutamate synthase-like GNAT family acetyltransferase